jgi:hypothetical protein
MHPFLLSCLLAINPYQTDGGVVGVKGQRFLAEIARTEQERAKGLMYRTSFAKDRCMFFVFEEDGNRPFWMGNCLIAIDMVWIKADGTVVEIKESAPPLSTMFRGTQAEAPMYGGNVPSRYVIEFAAGAVRRLNLKVGERVGWDLQFKDGTTLVGGAPIPKESIKGKKGKKK